MLLRRFVVLLCAVALSACGWVGDAGVKLFGDGFLKDDEDPRILALTEFKPRFKLAAVWSRNVGESDADSYAQLTPLVQGDVVFTSDSEGTVRALSARSGERLWRRSLNTAVSFGVGGSGRTLMVGSAAGEVIALTAQNGRPLWRQRVASDEITAISAQQRGMVLVRDAAGGVVALSSERGEILWRFENKLPTLTLRGMSVPLLHRDVGFIGLDDGRLLIVELSSGRIQREIRLAVIAKGSGLEHITDIDGQFRIRDGVLYVATYRNRIIALDIETQRVVWTAEAGSYAGLDVDEQQVYIAGTGGEVYALNRFSGAEVWVNRAFAVRDLSAPLVSGDALVVGDNLGYLYWLSRQDGSILARRRAARTPIVSAPVAWRRYVIALGSEGRLTATRISARLAVRSE